MQYKNINNKNLYRSNLLSRCVIKAYQSKMTKHSQLVQQDYYKQAENFSNDYVEIKKNMLLMHICSTFAIKYDQYAQALCLITINTMQELQRVNIVNNENYTQLKIDSAMYLKYAIEYILKFTKRINNTIACVVNEKTKYMQDHIHIAVSIPKKYIKNFIKYLTYFKYNVYLKYHNIVSPSNFIFKSLNYTVNKFTQKNIRNYYYCNYEYKYKHNTKLHTLRRKVSKKYFQKNTAFINLSIDYTNKHIGYLNKYLVKNISTNTVCNDFMKILNEYHISLNDEILTNRYLCHKLEKLKLVEFIHDKSAYKLTNTLTPIKNLFTKLLHFSINMPGICHIVHDVKKLIDEMYSVSYIHQLSRAIYWIYLLFIHKTNSQSSCFALQNILLTLLALKYDESYKKDMNRKLGFGISTVSVLFLSPSQECINYALQKITKEQKNAFIRELMQEIDYLNSIGFFIDKRNIEIQIRIIYNSVKTKYRFLSDKQNKRKNQHIIENVFIIETVFDFIKQINFSISNNIISTFVALMIKVAIILNNIGKPTIYTHNKQQYKIGIEFISNIIVDLYHYLAIANVNYWKNELLEIKKKYRLMIPNVNMKPNFNDNKSRSCIFSAKLINVSLLCVT